MTGARVPHWQRVERLREEAEQLSLALLAVSRRAAERRNDDGGGRGGCNSGVWEAVALRQQRRRECAERENARLRRLSRAQARHLRLLGEALAQRPFRAGVDEQLRGFAGRAVLRAPPAAAELEKNFQRLLAYLNREHARVDELWTAVGMARLAAPSHRWLASREGSLKARQYAIVSRTLVPFPLEEVQHACWARLLDPPLRYPASEYSLLLQQQGDTIQLVLSTMDEDFKLKQKYCIASRRYAQRDRVIVGTTAISEPRGSIDMASFGVKVQSTVLRVFREGERLPTGERSTIVEVIWSARGLKLDGVTQCSEQEFERYVDAGRAIIRHVMRTELNAIEEFLVANHVLHTDRGQCGISDGNACR